MNISDDRTSDQRRIALIATSTPADDRRVKSDMSIDVRRPGARVRYIAEWYRLDLDEESLDRTVATIEACASTTVGEDAPVELVAVLAMPTDEVVFGVFTGASADVVADVCRQAGVSAQRLTAAFDARRRPEVAQTDC